MVASLSNDIPAGSYGSTTLPPTSKEVPPPAQPPGQVSTSSSVAAYTSYMASLHRNTYASYIRLPELEKAWGLWHLANLPMPYDPTPTTKVITSPPTPVPAALFRLSPAAGSLELSIRLLLDFLDVNIAAMDDPNVPQKRATPRIYVDQFSRTDGLLRNINAQLNMMRTLIDIDMTSITDIQTSYKLTTEFSSESLLLDGWWWNQSSLTTSTGRRLRSLVQCHFDGLPFSMGCVRGGNDGHLLHLPYDMLVLPAHVRRDCRQDDHPDNFPEDHFFATVHQITEAWCCVMERQLDTAQALWESLTKDNAHMVLPIVTRRYRFCSQIWEFLIDHISLLSEMDTTDYLTLKLHLHGASGGQSVRLRQLSRRIPHLMPLSVPTAFLGATTLSRESSFAFDPTNLEHVLHVLSQVHSESSTAETTQAPPFVVDQLISMLRSHQAPSCYAMNMLQAIQMLENSVRRFYFGHQHLAILVLGAGAVGTQTTAVKMLERGWKDGNRYLCAEKAKEELSRKLDTDQLESAPDSKGRIIRAGTEAAMLRHAALKKKSATYDVSFTSQLSSPSSFILERLAVEENAALLPVTPRGKHPLPLFCRKSILVEKRNSCIEGMSAPTPEPPSYIFMKQSLRRLLAAMTNNDPQKAFAKESSRYRAAFQRTLHGWKNRIHFSTYGMGVAPDVAFETCTNTHRYLGTHVNEAWSVFFQDDLPQAERNVLRAIGWPVTRHHVNFGANVHEFIVRLLSCHMSHPRCHNGTKMRPVTVVTNDVEFVTCSRQLHAWSNVNLCTVIHVPLEPFATYTQRLQYTCRNVSEVDVVYSSVVFSNTQFRWPDTDIQAFVDSLTPSTMVILDIAQAIENVPLKLPSGPNIFCVGSGIKHMMAGPGLGFVAYDASTSWTPLSTGWIADLSTLATGFLNDVRFDPALRFAGGTPNYIYPLRQFNAIQAFYDANQWTMDQRHMYVLSLHSCFFARLGNAFSYGTSDRLTRRPETISKAIVLLHSQAVELQAQLEMKELYCDVRTKTHLRLGFGLHHVLSDIERLASVLVDAWKALDTSEPLTLVV
jgi:selenocysteine lyase/cysteine desulfurase